MAGWLGLSVCLGLDGWSGWMDGCGLEFASSSRYHPFSSPSDVSISIIPSETSHSTTKNTHLKLHNPPISTHRCADFPSLINHAPTHARVIK